MSLRLTDTVGSPSRCSSLRLFYYDATISEVIIHCRRFKTIARSQRSYRVTSSETETRIFRELSIETESSLIELKSSLFELKSSLIQLESTLIQLESSLIQLLSYLYMYY